MIEILNFCFFFKLIIFLPIASSQPPDYIVGVERIELGFVDDHVLAFIQSIAHLIQSCNFLFTSTKIQWKKNQNGVKTMKMLLECLVDKISAYYLHSLFPRLVGSVPAAYYGCDLDVNFFVECLTKQQSEGKLMTKLLSNSNQQFMTGLIDGIKKKFSESIMPSLFFFCFFSWANIDEFTLENEQTNEILS